MPIALFAGEQNQLQAVWTSFFFDHVARRTVGGTHMAYGYLMQLPVPVPSGIGGHTLSGEWLLNRVAALRSDWADVSRLERLRAEFDAAMFHLYGIDRNDVDYIMETFPIVKRKDIAAHGEYRTKRLILEIYDAMAEATSTGAPYDSPHDAAMP